MSTQYIEPRQTTQKTQKPRQMPTNKKQLKRMIRFVAALRKQEYPNRSTFVKQLENYDLHHNENIACSAKTIQRDIKALIEEFDAPIEFDQESNGYFLTRSDWKFRCPVFQEDELLALAVGARVAGKIFPAPISDDIEDAFDYQLSENNYDGGFDHLEHLLISSGLNVQIQPAIFNAVYHAWKDRLCLKIIYMTPSGKESERIIEPQLLAFHDRAWLIKAYCKERMEARNFAVHRITSIETTDERFWYRSEFSSDAQRGALYNFRKVTDVELCCDESLYAYVLEQPLHKDQDVSAVDNGMFSVIVPEIMEQEMVRWVMTHCGAATIVSPQSLKETIAEHAASLLKSHRG